ncbi:MAG: alpha/beta hydrolase [Hyphomicrobiales bacterium]
MAFVTAADGCRVHFTDEGQGLPVLMIPGLGGDGAFWRPLVERLAPSFRVLTMDHRGAGRSDRPAGAYEIPQIARDAVAVLDAAGIEKAVIVGHSTGGLIAQVLALDHADRVRAVVIGGSWAKPNRRFRLLFDARLALLEARNFAAYQKLTQVLGYPGDWIEANRERLERDVASAADRLQPVEVQIARIRMLLGYDRATDLHGIRCPALVVGAEDDLMVPLPHARAVAERIPGARLVVRSGGHFFPTVDPDGYAETLRAFLEEAA